MIIGVAKTKGKGRFAFRALVSYNIRQSGVASIRVGGGLKPTQSNDQWVADLEDHAKRAGHPGAAKHIWVSATHEEYRRLGRDGLEKMLDHVAERLGLEQNQRIGAVHMDATHWHAHGVYSRIRPDLTLVHDGSEKRALRQLAREWEKTLGVDETPAFGARINEGARNVESWTRLPSFARWVKVAAKAIDIARVLDKNEFASRWARLGVWYEPTELGGVLATLHNSRIVRVPASTAGYTPPKTWELTTTRDLIHQQSAYERTIESAKTRLLINEPTYARYLREREDWETTGADRAKATREALRRELATFDREVTRAQATLSRRERGAFRALLAEHRAEMKERQRAVRAEIVKARPSTRYGEWLKAQAREGDEVAAILLQRGKNGRKRNSTHPDRTKEQEMDSRERGTARGSQNGSDVVVAPTPAAEPAMEHLQSGFDAFSADGPAIKDSEISDLAKAQFEISKTQTPFAAKGEAAAKAIEHLLANLPQNVNRERVFQSLKFVQENPDVEFTALISKADIQSEHAETRIARAVAAAVLEAVDRRSTDKPQHILRPDQMAAAIERYAVSANTDKSIATALAARIRTLHKDSIFRVPTSEPLTPAAIESLRLQVSMANDAQPLRASLIPATLETPGFTDEQKAALKATLEAAMADNKSWTKMHETLAAQNLVYRVSSNERQGTSYRGGVIYQLAGTDGNKKDRFALKPSEIGYGLKSLERMMGPFVLPSQIEEIQQHRQSAEAEAVANTNGHAKAPGNRRLYDVENEHSKEEQVEAAAGELRAPTEVAEGHLGGPKAARPKSGAVGWAARLQEVEHNTALSIAEAKTSIENKSDFEAFASRKQLEALRMRARINVDEYPRAAWASNLQDAPEVHYKSAGSRFEYDRLQRSLASMQFVASSEEKYGNAVYLGGSKLPGFYDLGSTYKFTALTGVQSDPLKVAILASQRRWGGVEINGNAAFRKAALRTAAELGVTVSNADLQNEWTRIRAETERRQSSQAKSFETALSGMPADQQKTMATFGTPAVDPLSADALFKAKAQSTAHVIVRGIFEGDKQIAVFETMAGRLQSMEITPAMKANGVLEQVAKNGIWQGGLEIVSGGRQPLEFNFSKTIGEKLQQASSDREKNTKTIVAKDREAAERNEKLLRNISTITKGLQQQIMAGSPLAEAVNDVLTPEAPKTADESPKNDSDYEHSGKPKRGAKKGSGGKTQRTDSDRERSL